MRCARSPTPGFTASGWGNSQKRPAATPSAFSSRAMPVSTGPGHSSDTRTGWPAACSSICSASLSTVTPCLVTVYGAIHGPTSSPPTDDVLTMWPAPWRIISGTKQRCAWITLHRLTPMARCHSSSPCSQLLPELRMPALLNSQSTRPKRSSAASRSRSIWASRLTSVRSAIAGVPWAASVSRSSTSAGSSMSASTSEAPRAASPVANARPMPRAAPVTTATPWKRAPIASGRLAPEMRDHMAADVLDRLHLRPLRHRAHLADEEDLVGAGLDQARDVADAVLHRAVGMVRIHHHHLRVAEVEAHLLGREVGLDHRLARGVCGRHVVVPGRRVGLRRIGVPVAERFHEVALAL